MTTYCAANLRRRMSALTNLKESLRRNLVATCSSPANPGMFRRTLRGALLTFPHRHRPIADCVTLLHLDLFVSVIEVR